MGELQCTLEFSLELHKFINVDLFQRGFYQIRCTLKTSSKIPVKIEVNLPKNSSCSLVFPACIVNGTAVSKTFQILYKNEEVILDDIIIFKVHTLLEGHRVRESLLKADFQVTVELWFTDQSFGPDQHNSIHCVSTRTLLLHFDPAKGLHHHIPLLFDYFHLCAVTVTLHASLIVLCQPYLRKGVMVSQQSSSTHKNPKQTFLTGSPCLSSKKSHSSLEMVLFGPQMGRSVPSSARIYRARLIHWDFCSILLSAHYSLCRKLYEYMNLLPAWQQLKLDSIEKCSYLDNLSDFAKKCYKQLKSNPLPPSKEELFGPYEGMETEEEFLLKASSDITNLCGALVLLWEKFLEIVIGREKIRQHLSRQRHFQRVKRFSEAFFIIERTRDSALAPCDSSVEAYMEVSESLRKSSYLNLLPPLEVECVEFDGDLNTLPIFYEEQYQESIRRGSSNSHSSQSESTVSLSDVNFLVEETMEENADVIRRNSQGSLGQKYRSPDISATPTSPSAYSWCPESMISSSLSTKSIHIPSKKHTLKEKIFHNFRNDVESGNEECSLSPSAFTRINQKIAVRSKMKVRSRTVNFLRQLKKPQNNPGPNNSVVLLGVKKLESCSVTSGIAKVSRVPFALESGIRHSQSTLSVMSTLFTEGNSSIPNSESMPDLTSGFVPPPPPPPIQKSKHSSADISHLRSNLLTFNQDSAVPSLQLIEKNAISHTAQISNVSNMNVVRKSEKSHKSDRSYKCSSQVSNGNYNKDKIVSSSIWQESSDVFDSSPSKYQTISTSESIVSNQPSKSGKECIFDSMRKTNTKFEPPPPLSLTSEELSYPVISSNAYEMCPPSPPVQFKDPPLPTKSKHSNSNEKGNISKSHKKKPPVYAKSNASWSNESCLTSIICQGTLFFPRPPAQFGDDINESAAADSKEDSTKSSETEKTSSIEEQITTIIPSSNLSGNDNLEEKNTKNLQKSAAFTDAKYTILEMLTDLSDPSEGVTPMYTADNLCPDSLNSTDRQGSLATSNSSEDPLNICKASTIGMEMISFVKAKEEFRKQLQYSWLWYSDFPSLASSVPYFQCDSDLRAFSPEGMHLVVCVHGLDGNSADFRLVRTYLELGLPTVNFEFLMSERNQGETFDDFDTMTDRLVSEISYYIEVYGLKPTKISFIGHSLGNIIIRSAISRPEMKPYLNKLHTFLSLSGPHLGTLYNSSGLVNMGMWFVQKWKKSGSLLQLAMKDSSNLRQTFLYKLSQKSSLAHFRNILLFGSSQDRYVPLHSARIELCKHALKDSSLQGMVYREMVTNLLQPIIQNPNIALLRYDVHHALPTSANSLIGRAAHVAVLDSELFIEKFLAVCGLQFFT